MRTLYRAKRVSWLDIASPTEEDVTYMVRDYGINPFVAREFIQPLARAKVDGYQNYIYLVLHFPLPRDGGKGRETVEIDFIVGKDFIITGHYAEIPPLADFIQEFQKGFELEKEETITHGGHFFYYIAKRLYQATDFDVEENEKLLAQIEEGIFAGREKSMVSEIAALSQRILDVKQVIRNHESVLSSFITTGHSFFEGAFDHQLRTIQDMFLKVLHHVENQHEILRELRDANDSLLTTKSNEIMKALTMMALATFPLTLVAAIFAMDTKYTPLVNSPYGFWMILGIMAVIIVSLFSWFKYKGWLK